MGTSGSNSRSHIGCALDVAPIGGKDKILKSYKTEPGEANRTALWSLKAGDTSCQDTGTSSESFTISPSPQDPAQDQAFTLSYVGYCKGSGLLVSSNH